MADGHCCGKLFCSAHLGSAEPVRQQEAAPWVVNIDLGKDTGNVDAAEFV